MAWRVTSAHGLAGRQCILSNKSQVSTELMSLPQTKLSSAAEMERGPDTSIKYRHRRRHVYCASIDVLVLKMTASTRTFQVYAERMSAHMSMRVRVCLTTCLISGVD